MRDNTWIDYLMPIFFTGIFLLGINVYFYGEIVPGLMDNYGIDLTLILIVSILFLEVIFLSYIFSAPRKKKDNIFLYTLEYKFYSLLWVVLSYFTVPVAIWGVIQLWKPLMWMGGVVGVVVLFYLFNVFIAKTLGRTKKTKIKRRKTTKRRIRR